MMLSLFENLVHFAKPLAAIKKYFHFSSLDHFIHTAID